LLVGIPFGLGRPTFGIIKRVVGPQPPGSEANEDFIQTGRVDNPGTSGGHARRPERPDVGIKILHRRAVVGRQIMIGIASFSRPVKHWRAQVMRTH